MQEHDVRRIPVTDAGSGRLEGMIKAMDIINFLGGGEKYNIILKDFNGNFLSAINCPVRKIMSDALFLNRKASVEDAVNLMLSRGSSLIPITEDDRSMRVMAIVSERDVLPTSNKFGIPVREVMTKECVTASPGMILSDVSKIMVRNRLRRLPVILEDKVVGIVTQLDVLGFLGRGDFKGFNVEETLSVRVSEIMSKSVVSVSPNQDLADVVSLFKETGLGGFPVMEKERLCGIITTMDVIRHVYTT
jgi:CBS domain-containing protein